MSLYYAMLNKQLMKRGEHKSLTTDRVILVPGTRGEIKIVKAIFSMAADGNGPSAIARELNQQGTTHDGRPWIHHAIRDIVKNPKYMGCNVWNRHSQRLKGPLIPVEPQFWVTKALAFTPIVDEETFRCAQTGLPRPIQWSDEEILKRIRRLLKSKGRLTENLMLRARGMPSAVTIHKHFGTYRELYEKVGYRLPAHSIFMSEQMVRSNCLRRQLLSEIQELFPAHVAITQRVPRARSLLLIDNTFIVSILFCRPEREEGVPKYWRVEPFSVEQNYIALLCALNARHDKVLDYYVFPKTDMWKYYRLRRNDPILRSVPRLDRLSDLYDVAKRLWMERSKIAS